MTADDIKKGESEVLEFKGSELSEDPKKWVKTAIAFANGKGGAIVFGVEDFSLKITGIPSVNVFKFMDSITNEISDNCSPQIFPHLHIETIEDLLTFSDPRANDKVCTSVSERPLERRNSEKSER